MSGEQKVNCPNCQGPAVLTPDGKAHCPACNATFEVKGGEPKVVSIGDYENLLAERKQLAEDNAQLRKDLAATRAAISAADGPDDEDVQVDEDEEDDDEEDW